MKTNVTLEVLLGTLRSSRPEVFCTKDVLRNFAKFTRKHLCLFLLKKETLGQVFSCEFCKISKNAFSYRTRPVAASGHLVMLILHLIKISFQRKLNQIHHCLNSFQCFRIKLKKNRLHSYQLHNLTQKLEFSFIFKGCLIYPLQEK